MNQHVQIEYGLYSCGGTKHGCGTFAFLGSGGGPQNRCPDCGGKFTRSGKTKITIGFCTECWPFGVPDQIKPSWIPVSVVGGIVPLK